VGRPLVVPVGDGLPQRGVGRLELGDPGAQPLDLRLSRSARIAVLDFAVVIHGPTLREAGRTSMIRWSPTAAPGGCCSAGAGRDLYAGLAGRLVGVGVGVACEAVGHPVDEVGGSHRHHPGVALAGVDPPFEVLALAAEVLGQQLGRDHRDLLVGTTLVDEQGMSLAEKLAGSFLVSRTFQDDRLNGFVLTSWAIEYLSRVDSR